MILVKLRLGMVPLSKSQVRTVQEIHEANWFRKNFFLPKVTAGERQVADNYFDCSQTYHFCKPCFYGLESVRQTFCVHTFQRWEIARLQAFTFPNCREIQFLKDENKRGSKISVNDVFIYLHLLLQNLHFFSEAISKVSSQPEGYHMKTNWYLFKRLASSWTLARRKP